MKEPLKIIIVDDNESLCKTTSFILKRKGYDVRVAYDGASGIELYRDDPADIVLTDIVMPGIDGNEVFLRIKELNPRAIVILMTAYAVQDHINRSINAGAYGILYKPLDIEKVIGIIELSQQSGNGRKVMVVDDDEHVGGMLRNFFTRQGYQVTVARSGQEALDLAPGNEFMVAFIDMVMPGMDGFDTFCRLQEISPETKLVMMTGFSGGVEDMMADARERGACSVLHKPFQLSEINAIIEELLHR